MGGGSQAPGPAGADRGCPGVRRGLLVRRAGAELQVGRRARARRIQEADLAHPVILGSDGQLMDGGHRIAKAWLEGRDRVDAVRFTVDPEPDWVEADVAEPAPPG